MRGAALLGRANGEAAVYSARGGEITVVILEIVYQSESAGDYRA
jgi:transcription elongation GreA/GreB family factor